ncbi:glycoside hydrolase superfamily [Kockovaella imperatae]|uniref:beta-glucosidase n=1 Tax=Kockovaella imperatae TaxID=4999 RepID=A0A1Y1UK13_9TREE|nr:glycoside hydrolase superfamily [Kockovaella imperatae]ORX38400.1 glycoside hydrolase superfamily [Kockovaella imperatae]
MWSVLRDSLTLLSPLLPVAVHQSPLHQIKESAPFVVEHEAPVSHGGAWATAFDMAADAVSKMTVEEKVNLTSAVFGPCSSNSGGVPRLGIPGLCFDDGPSGPRYTDFVTQFPSPFFAAASFDRDLLYKKGLHIGKEFRGKGINVALSPITGGPLGRSPYAGRNWEGFSPDPYLTTQLSGLTVRAMQDSGLITCSKHYILFEQVEVCKGPVVNGQRTDCQFPSVEIDDKTFKELYLPSFAESVRAGTGSIMCSYNKINGTQTCENSVAMNKIMKDELNFQGFILSDYGATHSTVPSARNGMDMELPEAQYFGDNLIKAVKAGDVPESRLDDMARRILLPWYASRQHEDYPAPNFQKYDLSDEFEQDGMVFKNEHVDNRGDGHILARKVAADSTVLLKNDGVLPLKGIRRIGIFGSDAGAPPTVSGCGPDLFCIVNSERRYWNGTVTIGGGSGAAYPDYISTPLEAISLRARSEKIRIDQYLQDDATHFESIQTVAAASEVCMVFVKVYLVEGWDRDNLRLDHEGEKLIKAVEKSCAGKVVVVMHTGGQTIMEDWIDLPKIAGVIWAGYPGQESGNALVDILWGDVNPSGKLPFTMGRTESEWPPSIIREEEDETYPRSFFTEGLAIDYKWFDKYNIPPRFEFGFGLSYTSFELSHLSFKETHIQLNDTVQQTNEKFAGKADLYNVLWTASVNVTNTGEVAGAEVAQLYVSFPESEREQPPRHLKGFSKPYLKPGQSEVVHFHLRKKDLSVWDVKHQMWVVPKGKFKLYAGHSSRDLPLTLKVDMQETR